MSIQLLAIHGAGMGPVVWDGLVPHLAAAGFGTAFCQLTLPGHGQGDDQSLLLTSVSAMAQWLQQQIETDTVLIGHSMGAAVALAAAQHPKVKGVVAIGAGAALPVNAQLLALAKDDPAAAQGMIVKWSCDPEQPQAAAVRQITAKIMETPPVQALYTDLAACDAMQPAAPIGRSLLVISGARDKMTPAQAGAELAALHGGGQLVLQAGHMLPLEQAPAVAAAIAGFVAAL